MSNAIQLVVKNDEPMISSRTLATEFDKRHADVLRSIQSSELPPEINQRNFALVDYTDAKGEARPEYLLTESGAMYIMLGFTGPKAAMIKWHVIEAFKAMREELRNRKLPAAITNPMQALETFFNIVRTQHAEIVDLKALSSQAQLKLVEREAHAAKVEDNLYRIASGKRLYVKDVKPAPEGALTEWQHSYLMKLRRDGGFQSGTEGFSLFNTAMTREFGVKHLHWIPADRWKEARKFARQLIKDIKQVTGAA